jgi:hypothetical protein
MAFGDMFKRKLGAAATLPEKKFVMPVAAPTVEEPPEAEEDDVDEVEEEAESSDWENLSMEAFWVKAFAIDSAQEQGDEAYEKKLREFGLRDKDHWMEVRDGYTAAHQEDPQWQQAMVNARMGQMKSMMSAAANAKGGLFDPVEGITLEQYASVQARKAKETDVAKLLGEYGMDEAKWARVDQVFMARMSDPSDPMATAAFATEYGKFYSAASQGKFAGGSSGKEPVSFERYVEIMTAQECWSKAGKNVHAMLKKTFDMTAADWSNLGAYWSQKMLADVNMALTLPKIQAKYRSRYEDDA